jgi:ribosomal-protein-alanine acetyltransferase
MLFQMSAKVEDASVHDLSKLYEIEIACFSREAFSRSQLANLLKDYNSIALVAKIDSEIAGFIIGIIYFERNQLAGHILTVDVSPKNRRRGIGICLLQEIEKLFRGKGVKTSNLEVREDNLAGIRLYEKAGYRKVGKLKNYYGNVNGIYLNKTLS